MLVLFPFEEETWAAQGVPVEHVGHPLLDLPPLPSRNEARQALSSLTEWSRLWPLPQAEGSRLTTWSKTLRANSFSLPRSMPAGNAPDTTGGRLVGTGAVVEGFLVQPVAQAITVTIMTLRKNW